MPDETTYNDDFGYSKEILCEYLKNGFLFLHQGYEFILNTKTYKLSKQSRRLENLIRDDIYRKAVELLKEESRRNRDNRFLKFSFYNEPRDVEDESDTKRLDVQINYDSDPLLPDLIIECKRLANTDKNLAYIQNGVQRFVIGRYSPTHPIAGMIGFIETRDKTEIVQNLSNKLSERPETISTIQQHKTETFPDEYANHVYHSIHKRENLQPIELFHLMMDFCEIIEP